MIKNIKQPGIRYIISNLWEKLKDPEMDEMILHSDVDGDRIIQCHEWVNLMTCRKKSIFRIYLNPFVSASYRLYRHRLYCIHSELELAWLKLLSST